MNFFGLVITTKLRHDQLRWSAENLAAAVTRLQDEALSLKAVVSDANKERDFWKTQSQASAGQIAAMVANNETEGPKRTLEAADNSQAARAMSRNIKSAFVAYQEGVKSIVKELDKVCSKNSFTVRDLDKVQSVRRELRAILKREI